MVKNLSDTNSIANRFIAELRDVNKQQDPMRFRLNLQRLGEVMAYEISKKLNYRTEEVETPLGIANVNLPYERIFEVQLEYVSCPDLSDALLIVIDPMLATGSSMKLALEELRRHGRPEQVHIVTAIASRQGLDYVKRHNPDARIWMGALDEELTAKSFIVPGLGDAGDLAYGAKLQE